MDTNCRVSIFIPSYFEEDCISKCLEGYANQLDNKGNQIDYSSYEIVILENIREGQDWDRTEEKVKEIERRYSGIKIHLIKCQFPKDIAGVGLAREILTDVIAYRASKREKPSYPLRLLTEDAEVVPDPKMVYYTIKRFDEYPEIRYMRGVQIREPKVLSKNMLVWLERTGWQMVEHLFRGRKKFA